MRSGTMVKPPTHINHKHINDQTRKSIDVDIEAKDSCFCVLQLCLCGSTNKIRISEKMNSPASSYQTGATPGAVVGNGGQYLYPSLSLLLEEEQVGNQDLQIFPSSNYSRYCNSYRNSSSTNANAATVAGGRNITLPSQPALNIENDYNNNDHPTSLVDQDREDNAIMDAESVWVTSIAKSNYNSSSSSTASGWLSSRSPNNRVGHDLEDIEQPTSSSLPPTTGKQANHEYNHDVSSSSNNNNNRFQCCSYSYYSRVMSILWKKICSRYMQLVLMTLAILFASVYPILGSQYIHPYITCEWIVIMIHFGTYRCSGKSPQISFAVRY